MTNPLDTASDAMRFALDVLQQLELSEIRWAATRPVRERLAHALHVAGAPLTDDERREYELPPATCGTVSCERSATHTTARYGPEHGYCLPCAVSIEYGVSIKEAETKGFPMPPRFSPDPPIPAAATLAHERVHNLIFQCARLKADLDAAREGDDVFAHASRFRMAETELTKAIEDEIDALNRGR